MEYNAWTWLGPSLVFCKAYSSLKFAKRCFSKPLLIFNVSKAFFSKLSPKLPVFLLSKDEDSLDGCLKSLTSLSGPFSACFLEKERLSMELESL